MGRARLWTNAPRMREPTGCTQASAVRPASTTAQARSTTHAVTIGSSPAVRATLSKSPTRAESAELRVLCRSSSSSSAGDAPVGSGGKHPVRAAWATSTERTAARAAASAAGASPVRKTFEAASTASWAASSACSARSTSPWSGGIGGSRSRPRTLGCGAVSVSGRVRASGQPPRHRHRHRRPHARGASVRPTVGVWLKGPVGVAGAPAVTPATRGARNRHPPRCPDPRCSCTDAPSDRRPRRSARAADSTGASADARRGRTPSSRDVHTWARICTHGTTPRQNPPDPRRRRSEGDP